LRLWNTSAHTSVNSSLTLSTLNPLPQIHLPHFFSSSRHEEKEDIHKQMLDFYVTSFVCKKYMHSTKIFLKKYYFIINLVLEK